MQTPLQNVPLDAHTTLKVGGPAQWFLEITSDADLDAAVGYAQEHALPLTVLGGGSNVLIADSGVQGLVCHIATKGIETEVRDDCVLITAQAGEVLDDLVQYAVTHGYWGLENLSHIPGSVGATPVQNVGAYGVEVKDRIEHVHVYNTLERKFEVLHVAECAFGYRDSLFKKPEGAQYIVSAVTYRLSPDPDPVLTYADLAARFAEEVPTLGSIREAVIEIRAAKFPDWTVVGTAGSFFKNPIITTDVYTELAKRYPELPSYPAGTDQVKVPLAWILDKILGVKGSGSETVGQYEGQALVLINKGDATAEAIVAHAQQVVDDVHAQTGIEVEWEVTKVGF